MPRLNRRSLLLAGAAAGLPLPATRASVPRRSVRGGAARSPAAAPAEPLANGYPDLVAAGERLRASPLFDEIRRSQPCGAQALALGRRARADPACEAALEMV